MKKIGKKNQRGEISVYGGQKQIRDERGKSGTAIADERSNDLLHRRPVTGRYSNR
jgi:hypothetical protein